MGKEMSERLIEMVVEVFVRCQTTDKETLSYCLWNMLLFLKTPSDTAAQRLLTLMLENAPFAGKRLV